MWAIFKASKKKTLGPDHFKGEFYQTYRKVNTYPSQNIPKTEKEGTIKNSLYEVTITLIVKPDKDTTKKENYWPISLMNTDAKSSTKY